MERKLANQKFVDELLDPVKNVEDFKIPVKVDADFRGYQMDGIKWLAFLDKYKLHGILCDDMGLGKTLQAITVIVSNHFHRKSTRSLSQSIDNSALPSLVICPSTLCGHWNEEIKKFIVDRQHLDCIIYGQKALLPGHRGNGNRDAQKRNLIDLIAVSYTHLTLPTKA